MGKLRFTLSNILLYVALIASCLILEDVGFLSTNPTGRLSEPLFFMFFALAMGGYLSYFLIEHIKNKATLDYALVAILMLAFMGGCIGTWTFQSVSFDGIKHFEYSITNWDRVIQTLALMVYCISVYSILFYFSKNHPSFRKIKIIYVIIIAICLFATIYSWIFEFDKILQNLTQEGKAADFSSIFWNSNMLGGMLLIGIYACFALNYFKKNIINYIIILYLAFFICITASLTALGVMVGSLFIYFLVEIIFIIRKHQKRGLWLLALYISILVSAVVIFACALNYDMGGLSSFAKYIYFNLSGASFGDLNERTFTWGNSISFIGEHPVNLVFGLGFRNSNHVIGGFWYAYTEKPFTWFSAHSGYLQGLMNFGIIGITFLTLFLVYYFYCFFKVIKRDPRFALIYITIGLALLGYAVMESIMFLGTGTLGFLLAAFFYLPMINKHKHYVHKELGNDAIKMKKPPEMSSSSISKSLAKLFMGFIAVTVCLFVFPFFRENIHTQYLLINIIVLLVFCALFVPFIIASISKRHNGKVAALLCSINFIVVSAPIVYLALRYYFHSDYFARGAEWLFIVFVALILIGESLIFGFAKGMKFKDYRATLIGLSKNSFMGLVGAGLITLVTYFVLDYLELGAPMTYILFGAITLVSYYLASYLVPFKDQKEFIKEYNDSLIYSMKMDVLKDRLGDYNEKRRD